MDSSREKLNSVKTISIGAAGGVGMNSEWRCLEGFIFMNCNVIGPVYVGIIMNNEINYKIFKKKQ